MKKNTILLFVGILFSIVTLNCKLIDYNSLDLGYVNRKNNIKVKVYKLGEKKEIPQKVLQDSGGVFLCTLYEEEFIDRIEIIGEFEETLHIRVISEGDGEVILQNDEEDWCQYFQQRKRKHVYHLFPWIKGGRSSYKVEIFLKDRDGIMSKLYEFRFYFFNCYK